MSHDTPRATETVAAAGDNFLTVAEVALRLRVSKSTVYNRIEDGSLAAHCTGGGKVRPRGYRVTESQVEHYLAHSLTAPVAPAA